MECSLKVFHNSFRNSCSSNARAQCLAFVMELDVEGTLKQAQRAGARGCDSECGGALCPCAASWLRTAVGIETDEVLARALKVGAFSDARHSQHQSTPRGGQADDPLFSLPSMLHCDEGGSESFDRLTELRTPLFFSLCTEPSRWRRVQQLCDPFWLRWFLH